jgi:outer membrane lipoprotein SlyB
MLRIIKMSFVLLLIPLLDACVTAPVGPSIMALPGTGKTFKQFSNDDFYCREFANVRVGGVTPNQAAVTKGVTSAAVGTAMGAAAGAAFGGGAGAAIGAGAGLLGGGMVGAATSGYSGDETQQRYDMGYIQCMYGLGHQVPIVGQFVGNAPGNMANQVNPAPQNSNIPPPPAGQPPPPPPH